MLNSEEISVVVQGAINKDETQKCLKSVRHFLPDAEIILSTWAGSDVSKLEGLYDVLLLNKDPGAGYYYNNENGVKYNNINRQLYSTQEGLKKATRTYALKLRSDNILSSNKVLKYFDFYSKRDEKYSLFKHKIIVSTVFSKFALNDYILSNNIPEIKLNFLISDWWFLGLKEDLELYFDVPLVKEPDFSSYYKLEENKNKFNPYLLFEESYVQFAPEQYFAIKCFEKKFDDIKIEHSGEITEETVEQSRRYLINNFIFLEFCEAGIYANKYLISKYPWLSPAYFDLYNRFRQKYEYKKYCDSEYQIGKLCEYFITNEYFKKNYRIILIHFQRIRKCKSAGNLIKELFYTVFAFCICVISFIPSFIKYIIQTHKN